MEQQQTQGAKFEGWAIVEMFGHQRVAGYVTTQHFGTACLFQIDTPALPEREWELVKPEYVTRPDGSTFWGSPGTKVKRDAAAARSKLVGPGAIYALTPCTEEFALRAIEELTPRPLMLLALPPKQDLLPNWDAAAEAVAASAGAANRRFTCCAGTPEDGHEPGCPVGEGLDDEESADETDES